MMLKEAHDYSDIRELNLVPTSSTVLRSRLDEIMRLVRSRLPLFIEDSQAEQLGERLIGLVSSWHGRLSSFQEIVAPRLNLQIIHGDFQPENVLPVPGRRCVVIDFEKVGYGPPAYDVAKFIACSFFSDNQPRFSHFKATEFLCGYERVRSLSSIERESLHYLVLICQLSGLWALEEYYTRQNPGARRFITSYLNRLEWLEKHLGDLLNPRQRESSMYRGKQLELVQNPNGEIPDHQ
jgi:Ser/Thr protein kinase RdoA (MazF antagonist)